mgnify:CR=1 FL=1
MVTERDRYEIDAKQAILEAGKVAAAWGITRTALKLFVTDSVRAFAEQEEADLRLQQSLRLTGQLVGSNLEILKRQAAAIQGYATGVSDDYVEALQAQAIALGVNARHVNDVIVASLGMSQAPSCT